ncbi:uncharacterized protein FIBRA_07931 [Fibroporia radiculosa]|uniref:Secreted protein n=1 Tax=Fibroporia radiculosa TaxID=599839 RepID=J4H4W5_9APHY|nr:uncharacterized protein FIBRA_07931 [Fibroporia radiculosa]CCM05699.1 predicted protein [Fibroporia radiculosa]
MKRWATRLKTASLTVLHSLAFCCVCEYDEDYGGSRSQIRPIETRRFTNLEDELYSLPVLPQHSAKKPTQPPPQPPTQPDLTLQTRLRPRPTSIPPAYCVSAPVRQFYAGL